MKKILAFSILFLSFMFLPANADLPTLSTVAITGADDAEKLAKIVPGTPADYLYAVNFDQNNRPLSVKGLDFTTVDQLLYWTATGPILRESDPSYFYYRSVDSTAINRHNGSATKDGLPASAQNLFNGFVYNGSVPIDGVSRLTLTGLEEGKTYTLQIYAAAYGDNDLRRVSFSFDADADGKYDDFAFQKYNPITSSYELSSDNYYEFSEDRSYATWIGPDAPASYGIPYSVNYQFVAGADTFSTYFTGLAPNQSWHLYGFSLLENKDIARVMPTAPVIKNPSFEADIFFASDHTDVIDPERYGTGGNHGYSTRFNSHISGWKITNPTHVGLAPLWTDSTQTGVRCADFLNDAKVPDGKQAVFVKSDNTGTGAISQEILGFTPDEYYLLTYSARKRTGTNNPLDFLLEIGDSKFNRRVNYETFRPGSFLFQASDYAQTLSMTLRSAVGGTTDVTVLLDALGLELKPIKFSKRFGDNFSAASANINDSGNSSRFSGTLGAIPYIPKNGFQSLSGSLVPGTQQLNNGMLALVTRFNTGSSGYNSSGVTLDYNFADDFTDDGTLYRINFQVAPFYAYDNGSSIQPFGPEAPGWTTVMFGTSENKANYPANGLSGNDGFALLMDSTGSFQFFHHGDQIFTGSVPTSQDGWYDVQINYWVPELDSDTLVDVDILINGEVIGGYTAETDTRSNYISFMAMTANAMGTYQSGAFQNFDHYSYFTDFEVWASGIQPLDDNGVPEPATWGMFLFGILGGGGILGVMRRRK